MNSLKIAYRTVVMLGTLVVGGLAYRAYEPQIKQLEPVLTRVQELAEEYWNGAPAGDEANPLTIAEPESFPAGVALEPMERSSTATQASLFDDNVQPAARWDGGHTESNVVTDSQRHSAGMDAPPKAVSANLPSNSTVATIVQRLSTRGVTDYSLSPWGSGGGFYRFQCSVPWGLDGRYAKQFESVSAEPADAAREVLAQVERWQASLSNR